MTSPQRYNTIAILLHWLIAVLMIPMLFFGETMMEDAKDGGSLVPPTIHVSIGVAILFLTVVRLAWRVMNPPPAFTHNGPAWELTVSKITHGLFYLLMVVLPLSGWLSFAHFSADDLHGATLQAFGLFPLPIGPDLSSISRPVHGLGGKLGIALVILHVLAALKHQFITKDNLMSRMRLG